MQVLIADGSAASRATLGATLGRWGYDVVMAEDGGAAAWEILARPDAPPVAILD